MLGSDYKKERFGERLFGVRSQPANRGYLPGTELRSQGYGVHTLLGNWAEERADMSYYDGKPALSLGNQWSWHSTYTATIGGGGGTDATISQSSARDLDPVTLLHMESKTRRAYPGHEPRLDASCPDAQAQQFVTTSMRAFPSPTDAVVPTRHAKVRLVRQPGDSADAVRTNAVLRRLRGQLAAQLPGKSILPGSVARTIRHALRARACTRSATQACGKDAEVNVWELCDALRNLGLQVDLPECTVLVCYYGTDSSVCNTGNNRLVRRSESTHDVSASVNCLARALRGAMNTRRADVCDRYYSRLESVCARRVVRLARLVELFHAASVKEVREGSVTTPEVRCMFAEQWDVLDTDAYISRERFHEFYADVSFEIVGDDAFEHFMANVYKLD